MNNIRPYLHRLHPYNHLRLRRGFYLEAEAESDGGGVLALRWGDQWGLRLLEVISDAGLCVRNVSTNWDIG